MPYPPPSEPYEYEPAVDTEEIVERTHPRIRLVRTVNALIHLVCVLFAFVLAVHIILVFGGANPANGFAQLITDWARGVSLGLHNLFTPDSEKLRTLFNEGLAAVIWLVIGGILTDLVTRIGVPGPKRAWYRRSVR
ncbi:MAG TPA: hypothetical protein VJX66_28775 [Amycolatopsis sp.]|nr:hypothetical protein [Amycolatopsis sp.]